jgi:hypothetical protein
MVATGSLETAAAVAGSPELASVLCGAGASAMRLKVDTRLGAPGVIEEGSVAAPVVAVAAEGVGDGSATAAAAAPAAAVLVLAAGAPLEPDPPAGNPAPDDAALGPAGGAGDGPLDVVVEFPVPPGGGEAVVPLGCPASSCAAATCAEAAPVDTFDVPEPDEPEGAAAVPC